SWAALVGSRTLALYGDGAIAHAGALIARGADPYGQPAPGTFVAAIYPPVAYLAVAAGEGLGPFVGLRIAAPAATISTAVMIATRALFFDPLGLLVHVIRSNVLPYSVPAALAFAVIAVVTLGPAAIVALRTASGRMRAYVIGAIAVVLLAGRDGSSVNFLL